jgi:hypothetical protein
MSAAACLAKPMKQPQLQTMPSPLLVFIKLYSNVRCRSERSEMTWITGKIPLQGLCTGWTTVDCLAQIGDVPRDHRWTPEPQHRGRNLDIL